MKALLQRTTGARVLAGGVETGAIGAGLVVLLGVEAGDGESDALALATKIANLRCFEGRTPMDRTLAEVGGACLVVSQFTLAASLRRGNRPSFDRAARPELAEPLYETFCAALRAQGLPVATGRFGARMSVELCNDGPVTFLLESRDGRIE
jgi:D-tyrosyl-tRNA(Tyr) deacylase